MRFPSSLILLGMVCELTAAERPALPATINVAGGGFVTALHTKPRVPKDPASLSGVYDSHSITDGRQWLELKVHAADEKSWLVDGTLTTHYRPLPPEIVRFTNAPLIIEREHAWFETGIPNLAGHVVVFTEPRDSSKFRPATPAPAVLMSDSIYLPNPKAKPPGSGSGKAALKRSASIAK